MSTAERPPTAQLHCLTCREDTIVGASGKCPFCDTLLAGDQVDVKRRGTKKRSELVSQGGLGA
jgi:hypothetical protein